MYSITFNGENCLAYRLIPVRRPAVPAPEKRYTQTQIPGMDGVLIETDESYSPITISIEFNFMDSPGRWMEQYRAAKKWFKGAGWLKLGDDRDYLYKVYYVQVTGTERTSRKIGNFTADFLCHPYAFLESGQYEYAADEVQYNSYDISHPVYKITGNGACTLTVNGKSMTANVSGNITIDTELMMAYQQDGTAENTSVAGNYEDLYLVEGQNEISITDGFGLIVIPNWRCL